MKRTATNIRQDIEAEVKAGTRLPGEQLSSVRALAAQLNVSPNTVAAAYKQLRDRGVVLGRGRQGTVIAPLSRPVLSQLASVPDGMIDALTGSPDHTLLPDLAPAFAHAMLHHQVGYGDPLVDAGFARAARAMFDADDIDATNLTVTSGAMDAIEKVLAANDLRPGDRVGVEDPGHVPVHQLIRAAGLELVPLPIDEHGLRPEPLAQALAQNLAALIVTPRAHNPTGAAFTEQRATELTAALSAHHEVLLIQDDHAGAISGTTYHGLVPPGDRHVLIRSLGKSLGPDLRLSVSVGDAVTIDRVGLAVSNGPGWVSHALQRAGAYLLTDKATTKLVADAAASYVDRRDRLVTALGEIGVDATGRSGINVWFPTIDEQATVEAARSAGYAIRAADPYRIESGPAVRVTISNLATNQIDELAQAIGAGIRTRGYSPAM